MAPTSPTAACSSSTVLCSTTSTCCHNAAATRVAKKCLKRECTYPSSEASQAKRRCTTSPSTRQSARLASSTRICYRNLIRGTHDTESARKAKVEEQKKLEEKKEKRRRRELQVSLIFFKLLQKQLSEAQRHFSEFDYQVCRQFHKYCKALPLSQTTVKIANKDKNIDWEQLEKVLYRITVTSMRYGSIRPLTSKAAKARRWLQHVLAGTPSVSAEALTSLCAQALLSQKVTVCKKHNSHLLPPENYLRRRYIKLARRTPHRFCKRQMLSYITC